MARPPHIEIERRRRWDAEYDAHIAALEAKYGVPYDELPSALKSGPPEHPRHDNARRYDYLTQTAYRFNYQSKSNRRRLIARHDQLGWRSRRQFYLVQVEAFRQAEITVRQMRTKRTGRGKPLDRKAHVHARERVEAREWRDEL